MSTYFNRTLTKIGKLVSTIKTQSGTLSDIGTGLSTNMIETSSSINEITASIKQVHDTLEINAKNIDLLTEASESGRAELNDMVSDSIIRKVFKFLYQRLINSLLTRIDAGRLLYFH